jgi:hypothetical protein
MRSIKNFVGYRYLGKWIKKPTWCNESYKCVGESEDYVYVWYHGIHEYLKYEFIIDKNDNSDRDCRYTSYNGVESVESTDSSIRWLKK